jgi:hypothetical protein
VLAMLGKLGISGSFAVIYVFSAELFPTVARSSGVGAGSMSARTGGLLAPFLADLVSYTQEFVSSFVLEVFCAAFICSAIVLFCKCFVLQVFCSASVFFCSVRVLSCIFLFCKCFVLRFYFCLFVLQEF